MVIAEMAILKFASPSRRSMKAKKADSVGSTAEMSAPPPPPPLLRPTSSTAACSSSMAAARALKLPTSSSRVRTTSAGTHPNSRAEVVGSGSGAGGGSGGRGPPAGLPPCRQAGGQRVIRFLRPMRNCHLRLGHRRGLGATQLTDIGRRGPALECFGEGQLTKS
jgi:hypothetical protein